MQLYKFSSQIWLDVVVILDISEEMGSDSIEEVSNFPFLPPKNDRFNCINKFIKKI